MENKEKVLFIRTTDHIIQIDFDKYNQVSQFIFKLLNELLSYCEPFEKIEKILVCKSELKNW